MLSTFAELPVCVGLRLFMPEDWCGDAGRRAVTGVPEAVAYRPKWKIALDEVDRVLLVDSVAAMAGGLLVLGGGPVGAEMAQALRRIVLPQAVRIIVPPIGNDTISMLKFTSLVSVLALNERRPDVRRRDEVAGDPGAARLQGRRPRQAQQRVLRGDIGDLVRRRDK